MYFHLILNFDDFHLLFLFVIEISLYLKKINFLQYVDIFILEVTINMILFYLDILY